MASISVLLARFSRHDLTPGGQSGNGVGDRRSAAIDALGRALSPLLRDHYAMAAVRALLHQRGGARTSVSRLTNHEVLRQVAVLLHREWPTRSSPPARAPVSAVRYAGSDERSFDRTEAVRFSSAEAAATFLQDGIKADRAGLDAVIAQVKTQLPARPAPSPGRGAVDADSIRQLAVLLHKGDLAVAPSRDDERVFYFFRPRPSTGIVPKAEPAPETPTPRRAAAAPPPPVSLPDFPPLPTPSGAAPATCACMQNAAAAGAPFVAAA